MDRQFIAVSHLYIRARHHQIEVLLTEIEEAHVRSCCSSLAR